MAFPRSKQKQTQTSSKHSHSSNLNNKDISRASNHRHVCVSAGSFLAADFYSDDVLGDQLVQY